jgi:hypothetical protein
VLMSDGEVSERNALSFSLSLALSLSAQAVLARISGWSGKSFRRASADSVNASFVIALPPPHLSTACISCACDMGRGF